MYANGFALQRILRFWGSKLEDGSGDGVKVKVEKDTVCSGVGNELDVLNIGTLAGQLRRSTGVCANSIIGFDFSLWKWS